MHADHDQNEHELFDGDQPYEEYRYPDEPVAEGAAESEDRGGGRRSGSLMIASVLGIVVLGTAGVMGYRFFTGSAENGPPPVIKADGRPSKEVPAGADASPQGTNKQSYDRATDQARVVEPEEPAERPVGQPRVIPTSPSDGGGEVDENGVRRVRTFVVRPDGSVVDSAEAGQQSGTPDQSSTNAAATEPAAQQPQSGQPTDQSQAAQNNQPAAPQSIEQLAAAIQEPPPAEIRGESDGPSAGISFAPGEQFGIIADSPAPTADQAAAPAAGANSVPMPAPRPVNLASTSPQRPAASPQAPQQLVQPQQQQQTQAFAPAQTAAPAAQPARGGGFVVQVSSQRTEADARGTFAQLQQRFPQILGSYQPSIQPANLGDRGTYYRVRVGPFASREDATGLCMNLKTAGGDCVVQAN
ncbi:hypothetical protein GCM10007276_23130 [Agaricicola taiwanensis]|uniref:SPOR domain-containing protein n=2 Tax=Agaricicola taiwanensis TaxID=591372 RepID=A0A8J2YIT6_9RHOB|nr:hypothetical protein GCM10007276_23130 [Agaricicola taiwanensis]